MNEIASKLSINQYNIWKEEIYQDPDCINHIIQAAKDNDVALCCLGKGERKSEELLVRECAIRSLLNIVPRDEIEKLRHNNNSWRRCLTNEIFEQGGVYRLVKEWQPPKEQRESTGCESTGCESIGWDFIRNQSRPSILMWMEEENNCFNPTFIYILTDSIRVVKIDSNETNIISYLIPDANMPSITSLTSTVRIGRVSSLNCRVVFSLEK